ncbi:MAG: VgrG-related protein [Chloroflexota bacterium]
MSKQTTLASQLYIKLNGNDVQRPLLAKLVDVIVDQHSHLPDMFTIRCHDSDLKLLDEGPFDLTKEIEITALKPDGTRVTLMKGEITALEPNFEAGMVAQLLVRGYDKSHRLYRETKSQAFLNKKDSDLAEEIARAAGLRAEVEATSTVYDHIYQHNQSDLAFLMQRAWRIGYECFVADGKLYFRRPPQNGTAVTLTWGRELTSFRPRMTLAEQVDEVIVKGWDADQQKAVVGQAQNGRLYPSIQESKNGANWAGNFGAGKLIIVDEPVVSQAEANALAAARLDELSGAFIEAEGVAYRRPDIKAGSMVTLAGLGKRFSGTYLVTNATHTYNADGLKTVFTVRGSRTGLLTEQMNRKRPLTRWPGVFTAVVTNTDDPNDWGRVKVKFPWMSDDAESDWARVISAGAGPEAGHFAIPDVDDEVLVAFEQGDFSRPYVLGGLWNGRHKLPPEAAAAGSGEKPLVRTWHSRSGHWIALHDTSDNKIELVTAGGHTITLDDANQKIEIKSSGGLTLTLDDSSSKITVKGSGDIAVESDTNMKFKAGANMTLEATGNLELKASGQATLKGAVVNIN